MDGNGNGFFLPIAAVETLVGYANLAQGDVNFDGLVNGLDYNAVAGNWGNTDPNKIGTGDANGDGLVNGLDINMVAGNWGATTPGLPAGVIPPISQGGGSGSAVPEPSTWVLLTIGSAALWGLRRRRST